MSSTLPVDSNLYVSLKNSFTVECGQVSALASSFTDVDFSSFTGAGFSSFLATGFSSFFFSSFDVLFD